jgi:hypothetical protein
VLASGTYRESGLSVSKSNITICSSSKHGAIIVNDSSSATMNISGDNVTIRGLHLTSNSSMGAGGSVGMIRFQSSRGGIIEDNIVEKAGTGQISIGGSAPGARIDNVIVRNNILRDSGLERKEGEAIYVASVQDSGVGIVTNVTISGNTIENFTANAIDVKYSASNVKIHHNIFKNHLQTQASDHQVGGTLVSNGRDIQVHDNIIIDAKNASSWGIFAVASNANNKIFKNVVNRSGPNVSALITARKSHSTSVTDIYNNTFCNLGSYKVESRSGINVHDNIGLPGGAPTSACDAEEARIKSEMGGDIGIDPPTGSLCHRVTIGHVPPSPYGAAWTISFPENIMLVQALCSGSTKTASIGTGNETGDTNKNLYGLTYVWDTSYYFDTASNAWKPFTLTCKGTDTTKVVGRWCKGKAEAPLPANTEWFVGYTCMWSGARWHCGCTDTTCSSKFWQLQRVQR